MASYIRLVLIDLFRRQSRRRPDQARHGVLAFCDLVEIHGIARCSNGEGAGSRDADACIEPTSGDVGQSKIYRGGADEIACAIQQASGQESYSYILHIIVSSIMKIREHVHGPRSSNSDRNRPDFYYWCLKGDLLSIAAP